MGKLRGQQQQQVKSQPQPPLPQHQPLQQSQSHMDQLNYGPIMTLEDLDVALKEQGSPTTRRPANPPPQATKSEALQPL